MNKPDKTPKTAQAQKIWPHVLPLMKKINVDEEPNMKKVVAIDATTGEKRDLVFFSFK